MPEATGTKVGNVYLDLQVRDTIAAQLKAMADRAQAAVRQQFSDMGKAAGTAMDKGLTDAAKAVTNTMQQTVSTTVNGAFSKSAELIKAKMRAVQRQLEGTREQMRQLAATTLEWAHSKVDPKWAEQAAVSALRGNSSFQTLQKQQSKLSEQMAYLRDRLAIEVQAAAQKQAAAEQAAYEKTARAAEAASRRKQAAALQAQAAEAANAVHAAAPAFRQVDTSRAVRAASLVLNQSAKQASASAQQVEKSWNGAMNSITRSARKAGSGVQRFGARLGSIVSGALVFNLISTGLSRLVGWFGTAMSSSNSFRQALANLQGAASTAAAPLVQALGSALSYVINLLATGISYLARFISLLTGKSISSMKAGAQAMNNYGSAAAGAAAAAEKATHSLAGFDEITRLDAPQQTSGGGGGSTGPDYDFVDSTAAGFERLMDKARAFWAGFRKLYGPSLDAWGKAWNQVKATSLAVWPEVKTAASDLMNNGVQPFLSYMTQTWAPGIANSWSQAMAPITGDLASNAITNFAILFTSGCQIATDGINHILLPGMQLIGTIWSGLMSGISGYWSQYGQPVLDGMTQGTQWLATLFDTLYYDIVEPILQAGMQNLDTLWNGHLKPLWDNILLFIGSVQTFLLSFWNNLLAPLLNFLIATAAPQIVGMINGIGTVVTTFFGHLSDTVSGILRVLRGLLDFISGVFTGDWEQAWNGITNIFLGFKDTLIGLARTVVNTISSLINTLITMVGSSVKLMLEQINSISFDVPDWVPVIGGNHIGFQFDTSWSIPQIPMLASGGVIRQPTLAMMGEYAGAGSDPEIAAPQSAIGEAVAAANGDVVDAVLTAAQQIIDAIRENGGGVVLSDAVIGRAVRRYNSRQAVITGGAGY